LGEVKAAYFCFSLKPILAPLVKIDVLTLWLGTRYGKEQKKEKEYRLAFHGISIYLLIYQT
jgi:hypothetical protein